MLVPRSTRSLAAFAALVSALALAAGCTSSPAAPNPGAAPDTIIVDGSSSTAYILLGSPITQVHPATPSSSAGWDLGVAPDLSVTLNGGAAGPGGVSAYCVCENASKTPTQIEALTPGSTLPAFEAITAAQIPASTSFESDSVLPAISGWYSGTPGGAITANTANSWVIQYAPGPLFAKIQVITITGATAANAGHVTFMYGVQTAVGGAFTATANQMVDVTAGPVYFDFATQAIGTSSAWSIQFTGYNIHVNGGVSGNGGVVAVISTDPFSSINAAYAESIPPQVFSSDAFGSFFAAHTWYYYDPVLHQIFPRFETFFIRRGTTTYKLQVSGFYSASAAPFNYTFRAVKLTN